MFDEVVISRYLTDDMSDEEKRKLNEWQNHNGDNKQKLKDYESIWKLATIPESPSNIVFNSWVGWLKLKKAIFEGSNENYTDEGNNKQHRINKLPSKVKKFIKD